MNLFLWGYELAYSLLLFRIRKCFFLQIIKKKFLEVHITFFASLVIGFTIPEYFPSHVKGSVGIFESPHMFGQFRLVSSKDVK